MMKEKINEALNNIDISLVEEFVLRKEEYRKKRKAKKRILSISALAACLCIAIGIASVLPKILSQKK